MRTITKRLGIWIIVIVALLIIPLIVVQFTSEVNWDLTDFLLAGSVLFCVALAYELIARKSNKTIYRVAFATGLLGALLLFWVNGAVGIIGNENQTANLLYGAVFVVGLIGSLISKFKPLGMSYTLYIVAIIQMLVPTTALIVWPPTTISWSPSIFGVFALSGFFALLFVISAMLFRQASRK
jgi:hypothetical protein